MRRAPTLLFLLSLLQLAACQGAPPGYPYQVAAQYAVDDPRFARTMGALLGPALVGGNTVTTLNNGDEMFPAMLQAIKEAHASICLETYIYNKGEIGDQFTAALEERARAGVHVHVIYDPVGSSHLNKAYIQRLQAAGAQVQRYHPLRWFGLSADARLNNRTHRKLLIVDGRVGFTGGAGISDEWLGHAQSAKNWHDLVYRLTGPAVVQLQAAFMDHWIQTSGVVLHGNDYFPRIDAAGEQPAQVVKSGAPADGSENIQIMYLLSFAAAQKEIRIGNAYFVPDKLTLRALLDARRRGVRVRVIVPGPVNDVPLSGDASRAMWGELLNAGVEFYEYQPTMYHVKLLIVDDRWVSIGSANLDYRSFRLNAEANLNVLDSAFAAEQSQIFDDDLTRSKRVSYEEWQNRPLVERLKEHAATLFKSQL